MQSFIILLLLVPWSSLQWHARVETDALSGGPVISNQRLEGFLWGRIGSMDGFFLRHADMEQVDGIMRSVSKGNGQHVSI